MKFIQLDQLSQIDRVRLMKRSAITYDVLLPTVAQIMDAVRTTGDRALLADFQKRFGGDPKTSNLCVTKKEIKEAYKQIAPDVIEALKQMIQNITRVQSAQLQKKTEPTVSPIKGIKIMRVWRPIERVGVYAPGGKALYPSSVLMGAIPAQIAGCKEIILCSPARNGVMPAVTVVAADLIGIKKMYKIGGPLAIAAMTFGTKTIKKVSKIVGAGNSAVTAAKMLAQQTVAIDMPAGPSEIMVLADDSGNPNYIAADLLADGEHAEDSACVLVTTSQRVADETYAAMKKQLRTLMTKDRLIKALDQYGYIITTKTIDDAIAFANEYAPEHITILTRRASTVALQINNAGSVFVGPWTTKSSGDYATGANHILPTGGMAKMYPPLGVESFGKWMQVQKCTKAGLSAIRKTVETMSEIEELPAHKRSTSIRFEKNI